MDSVGTVGAVAAGLVVMWLLFRMLTSPWFWNLAILGCVVLGFTSGWNGGVILLLVVALAARAFVNPYPRGYVPPPYTPTFTPRDSFGRPAGDRNYGQGPPGPSTGWR